MKVWNKTSNKMNLADILFKVHKEHVGQILYDSNLQEKERYVSLLFPFLYKFQLIFAQ